MSGINKLFLMGNLVADPELKVVPSGISLCTFKVAVGRKFAKEGAEVQADFFSVEAWKNTADIVAKHFKKGQQIVIIGSIQNRNWVDQSGQKRYGDVVIADEVSFCGSKGASTVVQSTAENTVERAELKLEDISGEDDLPF